MTPLSNGLGLFSCILLAPTSMIMVAVCLLLQFLCYGSSCDVSTVLLDRLIVVNVSPLCVGVKVCSLAETVLLYANHISDMK